MKWTPLNIGLVAICMALIALVPLMRYCLHARWIWATAPLWVTFIIAVVVIIVALVLAVCSGIAVD